MKKQTINSMIILIALAALLSGCADIMIPAGGEEAPAPGTGRVTIVIPGTGERTIFPQTLPELTKYVFSFELLQGPPQSSGLPPIGDVEVSATEPAVKTVNVDLPSGTWIITAKGLVTINGVEGISDGEYPAAEGQYAVNVLSGKSYTVTINLDATQTAGKGVLAWDITIPNVGTASTATMALLDLEGNAFAGFSPVNVKANPQGSIGVAAGFFILTLTVDGVLQHVEVIQIYSGRTSLYESH